MTRRVSGIGWVVMAALLLTGTGIGIRAYGMQSTVPKGVTVAGWSIEGLSVEEFRKQAASRREALSRLRVTFQTNQPQAEGREAALGEIGFELDMAEAERQLQLLVEGSPFERAWRRLYMRGAELEPKPVLRADVLHSYVSQAWAGMASKQPVNAKRVITENDQVDIIPDVSAFRVDEAALLQRLSDWDVVQYWHEQMKIAERNDDPARDPAMEKMGGGSGVQPTANGIRVELPLQELRAEVTAEALKNQGVERKIGEFSTPILPGGEGRLHNIASAAKTVHDQILAPGGVFDYGSIVKETELKYGFQEAPVIFNGKLVPGIGGGICQVSSTLYNAVLRAGLEIVERRNHSLPVSYVPMGQDATFSTGYINFRFRNSTSGHLLIRTVVESDKLTVKLFGTLPAGVSYSIESVTVKELEIPVKVVRNPKLAPGRSETLQKGKPGYVVETYRTKTANGAIAAKELISKDYYSPQPALVAVGGEPITGPDNGQGGSPGVVEDGVSGPKFR